MSCESPDQSQDCHVVAAHNPPDSWVGQDLPPMACENQQSTAESKAFPSLLSSRISSAVSEDLSV
eukprot:1751717-Amphidinium_carterae.1